MSTSSFWPAGYGIRHPGKKAPIKILGDNDVFIPEGATKVEKAGSSVKATALNDSSNSQVRKGLSAGPSNDFEFKKPLLPGKAKFEKSKSAFGSNIFVETLTKPRSHSVPSGSSENPENDMVSIKSEADLQELYRQNAKETECYPEPEFFRDMVNEDDDLGVDGRAEGIPEFLRDNPMMDNEDVADANAINAPDAEEDYSDDDSFPEIERYPPGYATQMYFEELDYSRAISPVWERTIAEREYCPIPVPPADEFQISPWRAIGEESERPITPAEYDEDILPPPPCRFGSDSEDEEASFSR